MPVSNFNVAPDVQPIMPAAPRFDMGNAFATAYQAAEERNYDRARQQKHDAVAGEERQRQRTRQDSQDAWTNEARGRERQQWATTQEAGALAAQGDYKAAGAKAYAGGDLATGQQFTREHAAQVEKTLEMARGITTIAAQAQTPEEFSYILDTAEQRGVDVKKYRQQDWQRAQKQFLVEHNYEAQRLEAEAKKLGYRKVEAEVNKLEAEAGQMRRTGGEKPPTGFRADPNNPGRLVPIPGGPQDPAVNPPESASAAANYASRMVEAERIVRGLTLGADPISGAEVKQFGATDVGPGVLNSLPVPEGVTNYFRGPEHQKYRQAAMQWIRANLRKESGATISDTEFTNDFSTYFPQPGDGPDVVKQKEDSRVAVMRGVAGQSQGYFGASQPQASDMLGRFGGQQQAPALAGPPPPPAGGPPPRIATPDDYARLPPGTSYIAPDGSERVKQ